MGMKATGSRASSGLGSRRAIVVGGSLGGLNAAANLLDDGWDVRVFERSPVLLDGAGAGIVVHEAAVRYLVERQHVGVEEISCGSSVIRTYGSAAEPVHEEPSTYRLTSWSTLYRSLLNAVGLNRYELDHCLVGIEQDADVVRAIFASGAVAEGDLLVCADGINSAARGLLAGSAAPVYAGYVGWRGIVRADELSEATYAELAHAVSFGVSANGHIVAYPIPGQGRYAASEASAINYVWYRNIAEGPAYDRLMTGRDNVRRTVAVQPGFVAAEFIDEMRFEAKDTLAAPLADLVVSTQEPFLQSIVDLESPRMAFGRVALIGDAAFTARPHAAAGTAKAAENGWRLAESLRDAEVTRALAAWEPAQLELGSNLVARTRMIGGRWQFGPAWQPGDPELRFGLYGPGR